MTITKQRVTCLDCKVVFDADIVTDAPIAVATASLQAIRCPKCGGGKCGFGGSHEGAPPLSAPIAVRAAWWRERGDVGTSSQTIWAVFAAGMPPRHGPDVPQDPDDFSRCKALLDLIPEWRADIKKVATQYPWYKPFTDRWDEIERLYIAELPTGKCSKTYALMQVLEVESRRLQYPRATIETREDGSLLSMFDGDAPNTVTLRSSDLDAFRKTRKAKRKLRRRAPSPPCPRVKPKYLAS